MRMKFRAIQAARKWAKRQTVQTGLVHRAIITKTYKQHNTGHITSYWCFTVVLDCLHFINHKSLL